MAGSLRLFERRLSTAVTKFCRFGAPQELHSDQSRNLESHLLQEILQHVGVSKTRIHPQSGGVVERSISVIEEHLRKFVASHLKNLDARLPMSILAYRVSTRDIVQTVW